MANKTIKTLTMNNVTYEIVDGFARDNLENCISDIEELQNGIENKADNDHSHEMSEINGLDQSLAGKQPKGDYATKAEAKGYADAKDSAIDAAKNAADNAQNDLDNYKTSNNTAVDIVRTSVQSVSNLVGNTSVATQINNAVANKANKTHVHNISDVDGLQNALNNKEASGAASSALTSAKSYTDTKIAALINGAPTTLDTLGEIATAMGENEDVVSALEEAIGTKANASDLSSHTSNKSNPHGVTKSQIGLGNVENKSSATIRGELTKTNVTTALGYTPPTTDTTYSTATQSAQGLMSAADKIKLDGIATGANKTTVDTALSSTSTNPVQNKVVNTALSGKQDTITGAATTITGSNLTASRALVSDTNGKVAVSAVTSTELGYLDGVTSAIQTQLNAKAGTAVATTSANGLMSSTDKTRVDDLYKRVTGYAVTAGTTSAYTATITGVTLTHGTMIALRFNAANAASATLNVNSLGAKPIYYKGAAITASRAPANAVMLLVYDTAQVSTGAWHCIYSYDANTTYTNAALGQGYATCSTAAATVAKTASLSSYALTTGGIVSVKFTYDVPASATLNVNSKGAKAIYHKGAAIAAGVINAGDTATFIYSTQYHLISVDRDTDGLTIDLTDASTGTAATINATTLGGVAASNYALKTDTAANANKLGGKAAEYYTNTCNLLDNSNFEIAQAGYNGYHGANELYSADRWVASGITLTVSNGIKTMKASAEYSFIQQTVWNDGRDKGKTYTAAIETSNGTTYIMNFTSPSNDVTSSTTLKYATISDTVSWAAYKETTGAFFIRVIVSGANNTFSFKNIVLYEGTYTAETLPPYVPKGYAAELEECRRYYRQSYAGSTIPNYLSAVMIKSASSSFLCTVNFDTPMYKTPTLTLYGGKTKTAGRVTQWTDDADISGLTINVSPTNFIIQKTSAFSTSNAYYFHYTLSADL